MATLTIQEIRNKYPQYNDISDIELADKLHSKFYPDLPKDQVYEKLGLSIESPDINPEQNESTGILGVGADLIEGLSNAFQSGRGFVGNTPKMLQALGKDLLENPGTAPLRGLGQIGSEAASIGKGIVNLPYNINQYLARKHLLPQIIGKIGKFIPHVPEDTGLEQVLGLKEKTEGDKLLRGLTEIGSVAAGGIPVGKAIKKIVTAPSKQRAFQRALESQIDKAAKDIGLEEGQLNQLKDSLKLEYSKTHPNEIGELTPVGQQVQINKKMQELEKNPQKDNIPEGKPAPFPEKPDTKAMLEEHQSAIDKAKEAAEKSLDILSNPSIKAGGTIKRAILNVKDKSSKLYDAARNHYKEKLISADNSAEIKAATKELEAMKDADELAPGYGSGTAEQKSLEDKIQSLKGEKVNASDIFDLQRTMQTMAENIRKKQYAGNVPELEFKRLGNIAERLDSHAEMLAKRLESVGGKDVKKLITEANKGWKLYKQLSIDNPVGKSAWRSGNVPSNSLIKMAEEHTANDFMKAMVNSDPELRKQLLAAYSGEKNVNKLLKPSSVIDAYIKSLPEVEEKLTAFKNAVADYKAGEKSVSKIDKAHDELVKSMTDAANARKLQQQIKFHEEAIPKLEAQMSKVDAKSAEHARLQQKLKEHKQHLADKNHLLKKYGKYAIGYLGVNELSKRLGF